MRILVVEDEKDICADISQALEAANYVVSCVNSGPDADFLGYTEEFDGAILDLGLPGIDGLTVLKNWRRAGRDFPVLILTARSSWQEKVEGIDSGGDDYLVKPFEMAELLARLRAIIRRSQGRSRPILECGALTIDTRTSQVFFRGVPVSISALEYRTLHYLAHHRGRPVSRVELMDHIYGENNDRDINTLDVLIGRVRRKFDQPVVKTRRGLGYVIE